jgi:D-alanine-D-alanine ligase
MTADRMRVAVLGGGRSSEHDVSLASAAGVAAALREGGHEVLEVAIDRAGRWTHDGSPDTLEPAGGLLGVDVVFPAMHGPYGEDGVVQGLLECLRVPYVGADVASSALCMDKVRFKDLMGTAGIPQVAYRGLEQPFYRADPSAALASLEPLGLPVFVKPSRMGSSLGIGRADDRKELERAIEHALRYDELVIVEALASGTEVECGLIGPAAAPRCSPAGEIVLRGGWYDYAAKYEPGGMELVVPARIAASAADQVREIALAAFVRAGVRGLARADFFVDGDTVLLGELNTMPGFTPTSVYPKLWEAAGLSYGDVVEELCEVALEDAAAERGR